MPDKNCVRYYIDFINGDGIHKKYAKILCFSLQDLNETILNLTINTLTESIKHSLKETYIKDIIRHMIPKKEKIEKEKQLHLFGDL